MGTLISILLLALVIAGSVICMLILRIIRMDRYCDRLEEVHAGLRNDAARLEADLRRLQEDVAKFPTIEDLIMEVERFYQEVTR